MTSADTNLSAARHGAAIRAVANRRWRQDERGASAVEFAIVAFPFFLFILCLLQVGLYYMTQSSLDSGVIKTADSLRNSFNASTTPTLPNATTLKTTVFNNSGGLVRNNTSLKVEIRPLASLSAAAVPIADGVNTWTVSGGLRDVLALRAEADVFTLLPGMTLFGKAQSSALVRRQGR